MGDFDSNDGEATEDDVHGPGEMVWWRIAAGREGLTTVGKEEEEDGKDKGKRRKERK